MPNRLETAIAHQLHTIVGWFSRQRERAIDREEARRIAEDLGMSVDDLMELARAPADQTALMTRMLELHGLDREDLETRYAALLREMALGCGRCANKDTCRHDLDTGAARTTFDGFCSNAETIHGLKQA